MNCWMHLIVKICVSFVSLWRWCADLESNGVALGQPVQQARHASEVCLPIMLTISCLLSMFARNIFIFE